ncbi:hypothetical protein ACEN2J_14455 [Pseudorhodobacter sp. W20_MBD10_FR17]|uniref:hypothetical protein n=1 Tax=Pseudorhodobacter sp. W20_MBD10_FR17 TaxID=3240266 RepID=UPI003F950A7E
MSAEVYQYSNPELFMSWPKRRAEPAEVIALPGVAPDLDHGLIEAVLSRIQKKDARAEYWRDHVAILFEVMVERGLPEAVAEAVLRDHLIKVRKIHADRMAMPEHRRTVERSPINFDAPPPVGTEIAIGGKVARVVAVEPYIRKDGAETLIIRWDIEGRKATSGLRAKSVIWETQDV